MQIIATSGDFTTTKYAKKYNKNSLKLSKQNNIQKIRSISKLI